jgi:hypothetical protein
MICWCEEVEGYECLDCEDVTVAKNPVILKAYLRLCINGDFNPKNPDHKALAEEVHKNRDSPDNLTVEEIQRLKN